MFAGDFELCIVELQLPARIVLAGTTMPKMSDGGRCAPQERPGGVPAKNLEDLGLVGEPTLGEIPSSKFEDIVFGLHVWDS